MGYESNYMLTLRKRDCKEFSDEEMKALEDELQARSGYTPEDCHNYGDSIYFGLYGVKWYDSVQDLDHLMSKHKELTLDFTKEGEDHDDTTNLFWKEGERYDSSPKEFTPPILDGTKAVLGYYARPHGNLTLVAVDKGRLAEEMEQIRRSGGAPLIVNSANLFGEQVLLHPLEGQPRMTLTDELLHLKTWAEALLKSRHIPFSSPSPSSTEAAVKRSLKAALENIDMAVTCAEMLRR